MKEMERALSLVFKSHSSRSANNRAVIVCELIEHNKDVDDNSEANKSLIEVLFPVGPAARTTGTCQSAEGGKVCSFDCLVSSDENLMVKKLMVELISEAHGVLCVFGRTNQRGLGEETLFLFVDS